MGIWCGQGRSWKFHTISGAGGRLTEKQSASHGIIGRTFHSVDNIDFCTGSSFSGKKSSEKLCDGIVFDNTVWDCGSIILDWYFIDYDFCSAVSYSSIRRLHTIFRKSNRMAEIPDSSCMLNCGWNNSNNYPIFKKYHFRYRR